MEQQIYDQILERLLEASDLSPLALNLVDAACKGRTVFGAFIAEGVTEGFRELVRPPVIAKTEPVGAYLTELKVRGFRGIGKEQTLKVEPGPGLTVILGRNGSGKSSFAEALELLVTGVCARWERKPTWQDGWRNLHEGTSPQIAATFTAEASHPFIISRSWNGGSDLASHDLKIARGAESFDDLGILGWKDLKTAFRPFLSYAELGLLLEEPSKLFDKFKSILGLEEITESVNLLRDHAKSLNDLSRKSTVEQKSIKESLTFNSDPRARGCSVAISGKKPDLAAVEAIVLAGKEEKHSELAALRILSQLAVPTDAEVEEVIAGFRRASLEKIQATDASAQQSGRLAQVIQMALDLHADPGTPCPVCDRALQPQWRLEAELRMAKAEESSRRLRDATQACNKAKASLDALLAPIPPELLAQAFDMGLGSAVSTAWRAFSEVPANMPHYEHVELNVLPLVESMQALRAGAAALLASLDEEWVPVRRRIAAWLQTARAVESHAESLLAVESAEAWLTKVENELRDARFMPIAAKAQDIWKVLRQQSNVDLVAVTLEGKNTRRKVELNVTVDGTDSIALSVMSQGEINALALSLFLPRMTLDESPFRFLVVDDPVQSMDPHKVDGLARALEGVSKTRQVIVFTHDTRLSESIRRLQIKSTMLAVSRRPGSDVSVSISADPIDQYLKDATSIEKEGDKVGPSVAPVLVATFCRGAIEAACMASVRRRRLQRGDLHEEVEAALREAKLLELCSMALFDVGTRAGEVYRTLRNTYGPYAPDALEACKDGSHGGFGGDLKQLIGAVRKLAREIELRK